MTDTAQKIRPALLALAIGEVVTFPISRLKSVRHKHRNLAQSMSVSL